MSNSGHLAPIVSPVRAAVRIANSKARGLTPSCSRSRRHEDRQLGERQGRVMADPGHFAPRRQQLVQMAPPTRRVVALAVLPRLRPIQHRLDSPTDPRRRFRLHRPNGLDDLEHQSRVNGGSRKARRAPDKRKVASVLFHWFRCFSLRQPGSWAAMYFSAHSLNVIPRAASTRATIRSARRASIGSIPSSSRLPAVGRLLPGLGQ